MKKIVLFGWLLLSFGAFAQTPYFYYFEGKRQYFELDTKRAFISAPDKDEAD